MTALFWIILALILILSFGGAMLGFTLNLLGLFISGLVLGALARLLVRGTAGMGLIETSVAGILGSVMGGVLGDVLGFGAVGSWLSGLLVAALVVLALLGSDRGKN